jgi:uncharacterized lipoprotein YajG
MRQKIQKTLLLLSSALMIGGCAQPSPSPVVYNGTTVIEYPHLKMEPLTIHAKKQHGKVVLAESDFKKLVENYTSLKSRVKLLEDIIEAHNKYVRSLEDKSAVDKK